MSGLHRQVARHLPSHCPFPNFLRSYFILTILQLEIARTSGVVEPEMMADIEENLAQEEARLHTLREKLQALESQLPEGEGSVVPERKYDPEQHPLLKKTVEKAEPEKAVVLNTGDIVEVRYRDGGWYKAKIVTILGSASAPKYKIKYLEYDEDDTVDRDAVRPLQSKRKRDPEPAPTAVPTAPAPVTSTPHVISGPASVNPKVQAAKAEAQADDLEPKKRKIPNKKQLEKGVANWKNWSSKGVGKKTFQKPSMFRTGDNVNSRGESP